MNTHPTQAARDSGRVPVPADVDREDRLIAGLTARQTLILAATAAGLWALWQAARHVVPPLAYIGAVSPLAAGVFAVAVGRRDGISLDRWLAAALRHSRTPRRQVHAPEGVPAPPPFLSPAVTVGPLPSPAASIADGIAADGTVYLGREGTALLARVSTVNFALRTAAEQDALVGAFASWLNSLDTCVQIVVSAARLDLTATVTALREQAPALAHPALEAAALDHAEFLTRLAGTRDLLHRHVLLVHHQPLRRDDRGDAQPLRRRAEHATRQLAAADLTVTALDGAAATALLTAVCNPTADHPGDHWVDEADQRGTGIAGRPAWDAGEVPVRGRTRAASTFTPPVGDRAACAANAPNGRAVAADAAGPAWPLIDRLGDRDA